MTKPAKLRLALLLLLLTGTVGCDQISKHIARTELPRLGTVEFPGGLGEFTLAENPGSFLSLGAALPQSLRLGIFTIGVCVGLAWLFVHLARRPQTTWLNFLGLALVMAGGVSNLIDRVTRQGLVTDFIYLHLGPLQTGIFNTADMLIMLGIALLLWDLWRRQPEKANPDNPPTAP